MYIDPMNAAEISKSLPAEITDAIHMVNVNLPNLPLSAVAECVREIVGADTFRANSAAILRTLLGNN